MTTATALTQQIRDEHRELLPSIEMLRSTADLVGAAAADQLSGLLDEAHEFLVEHLIPHALAEDHVLYPVVEQAMGAPGATRTMSRDRVAIIRLADELGWFCGQLRGSTVTCDQAMALRRVLYGLHAIAKLHVEKAEDLYLPVLDGWLTEDRADVLVRLMEEADGAEKRSAAVPAVDD